MQEAAAAYMKKEMPVWNIHLKISLMYFSFPDREYLTGL